MRMVSELEAFTDCFNCEGGNYMHMHEAKLEGEGLMSLSIFSFYIFTRDQSLIFTYFNTTYISLQQFLISLLYYLVGLCNEKTVTMSSVIKMSDGFDNTFYTKH